MAASQAAAESVSSSSSLGKRTEGDLKAWQLDAVVDAVVEPEAPGGTDTHTHTHTHRTKRERTGKSPIVSFLLRLNLRDHAHATTPIHLQAYIGSRRARACCVRRGMGSSGFFFFSLFCCCCCCGDLRLIMQMWLTFNGISLSLSLSLSLFSLFAVIPFF